MKRGRWMGMFLVVLVAVAMGSSGVAYAQPPKAVPLPAPTLKPVPTMKAVQAPGLLAIKNLRGPELTKRLNQDVSTEGFYYDGSIPMVIDDFNRVLVDMQLPPDSYIPIVGPRPAGLKNGDRIKIKGKLFKPTPTDGKTVEKEPAVLKITAPDAISTVKLSPTLYLAKIPQISIKGKIAVISPQKYAVLIAGGINYANNHIRYWIDLSTMYSILLKAGYPAGNISVLYADGVARDSSMPVNYSATRANITTVFNLLASRMKSTDTLYMMLNDHGGGYLDHAVGGLSPGNYGGVPDTDGDEGAENPKIDETLSLWFESITDDQFAAEVNKITKYDHMIIQMKQCFCGGFIRELTGPRRTIMSSASQNEVSWSTPSAAFGMFTYYYFAALMGSYPDGSGSVNADANGDGKVSITEAYNFARSHDTAPETPFFEDDGNVPAHSGPMPSGGDGVSSANLFL